MHLLQCFVVAQQWIGHREPGAVRTHAPLALDARIVRNDDLDWHADDPANHRVSDAGVSGRTVEDGFAGLRTMRSTGRSLSEPPGLRHSILASTSTSGSSSRKMCTGTSGVWPMARNAG